MMVFIIFCKLTSKFSNKVMSSFAFNMLGDLSSCFYQLLLPMVHFSRRAFVMLFLLQLAVMYIMIAFFLLGLWFEGESAESWAFFLVHLLLSIPEFNSSETTVISDRDKGLVAVDNKFQLAHRAWCWLVSGAEC